MRTTGAPTVRAGALVLMLAGCGPSPTAPTSTPEAATLPPGASIDCGSLLDATSCRAAVEVALTAQLNPPPVVSATLRRPAVGDPCLQWLHPCDASSVIVTLQSGDTLQDVPLIRSGGGWIRLDLIR